MPGTDLRQGQAKDHTDKVLTVDSDGKVGNGEGDEIDANFLTKGPNGSIGDSRGNYQEILNSQEILKTGNTSTFSPIDLDDYTIGGDDVYEVHCLASNTSADKFDYEKFIYIEHINASEKVTSVGGGGHSFAIDSNGVISQSGGGDREYRIRIKRIML